MRTWERGGDTRPADSREEYGEVLETVRLEVTVLVDPLRIFCLVNPDAR